MTISPQTLRDLADFWIEQGGVNLGIVGDSVHQARPSYHNGQDVINANGWTATSDYSIRHVRDREPNLTNAAAAIDLGKLDGTFGNLRTFSEWLVGQCQANAPGSADIREIIYWSAKNERVERWDGYDRVVRSGPGQGDLSHKFHTHVSFPRDSETRDKRPLWRPFFDDTQGEEEMLTFTLDPAKPHHGTVQIVGDDVQAIYLDTGELVGVFDGEEKEHIGFGKLEKPYGTGTGAQADRKTGWLLYGPRPAWLLAYAGREIPSTGGDDFNAGVEAASLAALEAKR